MLFFNKGEEAECHFLKLEGGGWDVILQNFKEGCWNFTFYYLFYFIFYFFRACIAQVHKSGIFLTVYLTLSCHCTWCVNFYFFLLIV